MPSNSELDAMVRDFSTPFKPYSKSEVRARLTAWRDKEVEAVLEKCYTQPAFDTPAESVQGKMADIALNVQQELKRLRAAHSSRKEP